MVEPLGNCEATAGGVVVATARSSAGMVAGPSPRTTRNTSAVAARPAASASHGARRRRRAKGMMRRAAARRVAARSSLSRLSRRSWALSKLGAEGSQAARHALADDFAANSVARGRCRRTRVRRGLAPESRLADPAATTRASARATPALRLLALRSRVCPHRQRRSAASRVASGRALQRDRGAGSPAACGARAEQPRGRRAFRRPVRRSPTSAAANVSPSGRTRAPVRRPVGADRQPRAPGAGDRDATPRRRLRRLVAAARHRLQASTGILRNPGGV